MKGMTARVVIVFAALMVAAVAVARADRYETVPLRTSFEEFPMQIGDWRGVLQPPMAQSALDVLGLSDYVVRGYVAKDNSSSVGLYVGYWKSQRQGETIHSPQNCLPGAGWEPVSQGIITISDPRQPEVELPVNRYVIQKGLERQVVLYWFQSHGRIVASEYWSKIYLVTDAVRMNRTDGAIVRVMTRVKDESPDGLVQADRVASSFVKDLLPKLDTFLPN